jgi:hypothetical protein
MDTFCDKFKNFFEDIECAFIACISDDTDLEKHTQIEMTQEINEVKINGEEIIIIKKNNETFYLIGSESIKI